MTHQGSLVDYVDAALASAPWRRFAVVAHSSGGVVGAELARLAPERVSAFLAVSAVVPKPGASFVSSMPLPNRLVLNLAMRFAGTRPPDAAIRRGLAAGLDKNVADRVIADFVPESIDLYRGKTTLGCLPQRRGYVLTLRDRELSLPPQRRFADRLDVPWQEELDTGHLPMLQDPRSLANAIGRFLDQPS